jgi:hypothetical protein
MCTAFFRSSLSKRMMPPISGIVQVTLKSGLQAWVMCELE